MVISVSPALRQVSWFIAVGCAAAATHWLVVIATVTQLNLPPLLANVIGWSVAFLVSFAGHYRLTFRHHATSILIAARRFWTVSAIGFLINEAAYAFLLKTTALRYDVLLFFVLLAVAVLTFFLSRYWAFRSDAI